MEGEWLRRMEAHTQTRIHTHMHVRRHACTHACTHVFGVRPILVVYVELKLHASTITALIHHREEDRAHVHSRAQPEMHRCVSARRALTSLDSWLTLSSEAKKTNGLENVSRSSLADR